MTTLALDLGSHVGWAVRLPDGSTVSGTESFKGKNSARFEGGGMRYLRFLDWLNDIESTANGVDIVYFEEVRSHQGVDAAHVYGGFMATLTSWCERREIPYQGVPVATIKRHATGRGNSNKAVMIDAMRALGYEPIDDNEADALALLHCALETGVQSVPERVKHDR